MEPIDRNTIQAHFLRAADSYGEGHGMRLLNGQHGLSVSDRMKPSGHQLFSLARFIHCTEILHGLEEREIPTNLWARMAAYCDKGDHTDGTDYDAIADRLFGSYTCLTRSYARPTTRRSEDVGHDLLHRACPRASSSEYPPTSAQPSSPFSTTITMCSTAIASMNGAIALSTRLG
jgi:hypothetical protein